MFVTVMLLGKYLPMDKLDFIKLKVNDYITDTLFPGYSVIYRIINITKSGKIVFMQVRCELKNLQDFQKVHTSGDYGRFRKITKEKVFSILFPK